MKLSKTTKFIIVASTIVIIGIIGLAFYLFVFAARNNIIVERGQISNVKTMVQLCSIDFYNEAPIVDTLQNWEFFGKQKQTGSISFDVENLQINDTTDTVSIILPPEIIEIRESMEEKSWESIDSKDLRPLRFSKAPTELWNKVKKNAPEKSKGILYKNGTVEKARAEGAESLKGLMEKVYRKPVKVIDPTPKGAYYDKYK